MSDSGPQVQRVAAYNVCVDAQSRLLLCRLSDITERPGWWTLPGGGINFGEHPSAGALRELTEETGLIGQITGLLTVESHRRPLGVGERARLALDVDVDAEYHSVQILYRTEIIGGELRDETQESTDHADWCTREDLESMQLLGLARIGVELAFGESRSTP